MTKYKYLYLFLIIIMLLGFVFKFYSPPTKKIDTRQYVNLNNVIDKTPQEVILQLGKPNSERPLKEQDSFNYELIYEYTWGFIGFKHNRSKFVVYDGNPVSTPEILLQGVGFNMGNLRTITHSPLNSTYQYGLFNVVASKVLGKKEYSVVVIEPSQNSRNSLNIDK